MGLVLSSRYGWITQNQGSLYVFILYCSIPILLPLMYFMRNPKHLKSVLQDHKFTWFVKSKKFEEWRLKQTWKQTQKVLDLWLPPTTPQEGSQQIVENGFVLITHNSRFLKTSINNNPGSMFTRRLVGSTDQAESSGFYFRIAWKSTERPCFLQNHFLAFLQGLGSLKNWLL